MSATDPKGTAMTYRTESEATADGFQRTGWGSRSPERCEANAAALQRTYDNSPSHKLGTVTHEVVVTDDGRGYRVMRKGNR